MTTCEDCGEQIKLRNVKGAVWRKTCLCPDFSSFIPKEPATIVVPSRHNDIFQPCCESIDKFCPKQNKILVRDGNEIESPVGWKTVQAPDKFVYSRNVNLGIKESTGDVLLCNDDCVFTHRNTIEIMQGVLDKYPEVGVLSPLIDGMVGHYDQGHATRTLHITECRLCFVCVLIRRSVLDEIGLLDESIGANGGYGWDDTDASRRVVNAGYKLGTTARATVKHGHVDGKWSTSFRRQHITLDAPDKIAAKQFFDKWHDNDLGCYGKERAAI